MRTLGTIWEDNFQCVIREDDNRRVYFTGDADIDADGANGQNGEKPAYMVNDKGSEALANGGMGIRRGKVVGVTTWFDSIVILDNKGNPRVFPGGIIASKTAYRFPDKSPDDPEAYVDSEVVPYIVVPPLIITRTAGVVMGCRARATVGSKKIEAVVADAGPRSKIGEVSIQLARMLGINPSPRSGGTNKPIVKYELWPGVPAEVNGRKFVLQRSNGTHVI